MKKIRNTTTKNFFLLPLISLLFFKVTLAQNPVPNPSFESWVGSGAYEEPEFWGTQNAYTGDFGLSTVTKDSSAHSGNLAARIVTKGHNNTFITGIICTGVVKASDFSCVGGFPANFRFAYFSGYFKYSPSLDSGTNDLCMMTAWMWKWNDVTNKRDTVAVASFKGGSAADYVLFIAPFEFKTAETPDSAVIYIASTDSILNAPVGSVLLLDDVAFTGSVGIEEVKSHELFTYPNPADDQLSIRLPQNATLQQFKIYDSKGSLVNTIAIPSSSDITLDTRMLLNGIYFFRADGDIDYASWSGKFVVQH